MEITKTSFALMADPFTLSPKSDSSTAPAESGGEENAGEKSPTSDEATDITAITSPVTPRGENGPGVEGEDVPTNGSGLKDLNSVTPSGDGSSEESPVAIRVAPDDHEEDLFGLPPDAQDKISPDPRYGLPAQGEAVPLERFEGGFGAGGAKLPTRRWSRPAALGSVASSGSLSSFGSTKSRGRLGKALGSLFGRKSPPVSPEEAEVVNTMTPNHHRRHQEAEARADAEKEEKEIMLSELTHSWRSSIIPAWRGTGKRPEGRIARAAFQQEVPSAVREEVWELAIGNELRITDDLVSILVEKARSEKDEARMRGPILDAPRTFPELGMFGPGAPLHEPLKDLLSAWVVFRPEVGYVSGMHMVAAMLLLTVGEKKGFSCFANLMVKPFWQEVFGAPKNKIEHHCAVFDLALAETLPTLSKYMKHLGLDSRVFLAEWLLSMFCRAVPLDVAARLWDMILLSEDSDRLTVTRTALGLLRMLSSEVLNADFERAVRILASSQERALDRALLVSSVASVKLSSAKYAELVKQVEAKASSHL